MKIAHPSTIELSKNFPLLLEKYQDLSFLSLLVVDMVACTIIAVVLVVEEQSQSMEARYLLVHVNAPQLE